MLGVRSRMRHCCTRLKRAVPLRLKETTTLPTTSNKARSSEARARAEASFSKEERARDGAKAMMEYLANGQIVRERMARLRALRLAKEAVDKRAELAKSATGKRRSSKAQQGS